MSNKARATHKQCPIHGDVCPPLILHIGDLPNGQRVGYAVDSSISVDANQEIINDIEMQIVTAGGKLARRTDKAVSA